MRPAPALALQCAPSQAWRLACAAIGAAAGAAVAAWGAAHLEWTLAALGAAAAPAALAGAGLGLRIAGRPVTVEIGWDGQQWRVDGVEGELQLMLDFGRWLLLLCHRPAAGPGTRWVGLAFAPGADGLRALRTALYSRPPEATPAKPHVRAPDRATD